MESTRLQELPATPVRDVAGKTVFTVLFAISFSHLLNDTIQALLPAIYPVLKQSYHLSFSQLGLITFTFQVSSSLLQPVVGWYTDGRPQRYSLPVGMALTLAGLLCLSVAGTFPAILCSSALVGIGSAVFHPEASRIAYMAAGKRRGLAQSLFQVGGNAGSSLGPLLAALIIVPHGQAHLAWFSVVAFLGILVLWQLGSWQRRNAARMHPRKAAKAGGGTDLPALPRRTVAWSLAILGALIFSKFFYMAAMTSYYTFYLMDRFHLSVQSSQVCLFIFLFSVAAGTILGGPVGDRIGRKRVIWGSILGAAPFTLWLPHAGLEAAVVMSVFTGVILSSAFSAILVYAQELVPGKVGMISGLFFGLAFGMAGIGSAALGWLADHTSITYVFQVCAFLPLIGLLTAFLPELEVKQKKAGS